jgi:putative RNA 2'-phosphotransferase
VILVIQTGAMHRDGHAFQIADNGVWLTPHVPPRYIRR